MSCGRSVQKLDHREGGTGLGVATNRRVGECHTRIPGLYEYVLAESEQTAVVAQTEIMEREGDRRQKEVATARSSCDSLVMLEQAGEARVADDLLSFLQRIVDLGPSA